MAELQHAIGSDELFLQYQPKVQLSTGLVCGVEVLARWHHPQRGFIPPSEFIPLAERTGLIKPLSWRVLENALEQCAAWRRAGQPLAVAVNLSVLNLHEPHLVGTILSLLDRWDLPRTMLSLELTETGIMGDMEHARAVLTHLGQEGVRLSIDDFGTGYSSLAYLKQLPVAELKIDRAFVGQMAGSTADAAIVRAVIAMAHALDLELVAEGVEDVATWDLLAAAGCDVAQGYYVSKPLPAAEVAQWLRTVRGSVAAVAGGQTA